MEKEKAIKYSVKIIVNGELFFTNELSVEEIEQLKKFLENNMEVLRYGKN